MDSEQRCAEALYAALPESVTRYVWTTMAGGEFIDAMRDMLRMAAINGHSLPASVHALAVDEFLTGDYEPEFEAEIRGYLDRIRTLVDH